MASIYLKKSHISVNTLKKLIRPLMVGGEEMRSMRTAGDSSPQPSLLQHNTLYSYLRLCLLAEIIKGNFLK